MYLITYNNNLKTITKMRTYKANFNANNGTHFAHDITGNNKYKLLQTVRNIALSERFAGNTATYAVYDDNDITMFYGIIRPNGTIYYLVYNGEQR